MALLDTSYNDYYTIHCLALEYKDGNKESGIALISKFYNLINGYSILFKTGTADVNNISIRNFIKYFAPNKNITQLMFLNRYKTTDLNKTQNIINFRLMTNNLSEEDFQQELYLALLKMATRYKDTKPSFHTYVSKTFHFVLLESLKINFKNVSINSNIIEPLTDENLLDDCFDVKFDMFINNLSYEIENSCHKIKVKHCSIYSDDFFNDNWILGNYSSSYFYKFSNFEREIIRDNYILNIPDKSIALKYGLCKHTIFRKRNKILNDLLSSIYK